MKKLLLLGLLLSAISVSAQNLWYDIAETAIPLTGERRIVPRKSRTVIFNLTELQSRMAQAPLRFSSNAQWQNAPLLELPAPDGSIMVFRIMESPVMHPDLQARHPESRCYTGICAEDPGALLKCDLTPWGFHAYVLRSRAGDWFIDPWQHGDRDHYNVYFRRDYLPADAGQWQCFTDDTLLDPKDLIPGEADQGDCKLRQYTLALACTGEYADFHGGTVAGVEAAMSTSLNRINGVYELEFAVSMSLVANNDTLIYLNGATDPYTNDDGVAMLTENQTTCDARIGSANYDIGHVFSTGGGGVAFKGCVCSATNKAKGVTGSPSPVGDAFDIDYVAHEMGHQFGDDHTFNGTHGSCNGNRVLASAYEPGSGSTIMAYAGICDDQDIQPHSDAYFHARSLQQTGSFVTGGTHTCDTEVVTGNSAPTANAGADYTIPKSTPFVLTATGSDPDGDAITYCWEQYDNQSSTQPPLSTSTGGPNFRSFTPVSAAERYFPALAEVVNNASPTWEVLPSVGRSLNFRLTVRDNYGGAGCTKEDNMVVTVSGTIGPFQVTAPNTAVSWNANSSQTVTWNVSGTNGGAVNCANVEIALSTDGGYNYNTVILASTANDGSEIITVPNEVSGTCRIRIRGVGNVFYDISNVNFSILPALPVELLYFKAGLEGAQAALLEWETATEKDNMGFEVQHSATGAAFQTIGFVEGRGTSSGGDRYRFQVPALTPGKHYFRLRQVDADGTVSYSGVEELRIRQGLVVSAAPNPIDKQLNVNILQESSGPLHITLIDPFGRARLLLSEPEVPAENSFWKFDLGALPAGVYYLLCDNGNEQLKQVLVKR